MKKAKKNIVKVLGIIAVLAIFILNLTVFVGKNDQGNDLSLTSLQAYADTGEGGTGVDYGHRYINNDRDCTGTQIVHCSFGADLTKWGIGNCTIGFDYPITFNGRENTCLYTGNVLTGCTYYMCKRTT